MKVIEMKKNRILAIVVLYNPDISEVLANINRYIVEVDTLIIWLNSVINIEIKRQILDELKSYDVIFQGDGTNRGLSIALNYAVSFAKKNMYKYLMTMDQDSYWINIQDYFMQIFETELNEKDIGIFGPYVITDVSERNDTICNYNQYPDHVITSGTVYLTEIFDVLSGFNEEYFIDAIDEEICLRASKFGFKTKIMNKGKLLQKFGNPTKCKFLYKYIYTPNYSAFRYFYIVRNHIWLLHSDLLNKKQKRKVLRWYIINPFVKVLLFEDNKVKKMQSIFCAIYEGVIKFNS